MNKIMNCPACTYNSQPFAQSQKNFAPLHDGETVSFSNSECNHQLGTEQFIKLSNGWPCWRHTIGGVGSRFGRPDQLLNPPTLQFNWSAEKGR